MEQDDELLVEIGDFRVRSCCTIKHLFLERISTHEGGEVPEVEIEQILRLPAQQREPALQQCWDAHF